MNKWVCSWLEFLGGFLLSMLILVLYRVMACLECLVHLNLNYRFGEGDMATEGSNSPPPKVPPLSTSTLRMTYTVIHYPGTTLRANNKPRGNS